MLYQVDTVRWSGNARKRGGEQHKVTLTLTTPAGVREKKLNCYADVKREEEGKPTNRLVHEGEHNKTTRETSGGITRRTV